MGKLRQHQSTIVDPISHLKSVGWQVGFAAVKKSKSSEIMSNCKKMSDYKQGTPHSLHHCTKRGIEPHVVKNCLCCLMLPVASGVVSAFWVLQSRQLMLVKIGTSLASFAIDCAWTSLNGRSSLHWRKLKPLLMNV